MAPDPTNLFPICDQVLPMRVNIHTAPLLLSSAQPPIVAVFPSALKATL